jgi:hypothetical protein
MMCWKTTGDWRHPLWVSVAGCLGYDVLVQIGNNACPAHHNLNNQQLKLTTADFIASTLSPAHHNLNNQQLLI